MSLYSLCVFRYNANELIGRSSLVKLYTKHGDDGTTGLIGGARVSKDDPRVGAYGEVDELNAVLGWCAVQPISTLIPQLQQIQRTLFVVGAELASPAPNKTGQALVPIDDADVVRLENWIDEATADSPALDSFILPGGSESGSRLHVARAVCRRAERAVVGLAKKEDVRPVIVRYLNRFSDLLFAWARQQNHAQG